MMNQQNQMMDLVKANMMMNSKDSPIYTFILMTVLEFMMKYLTVLTNYLKSYGDKWFQDKFKLQLNKLPINTDLETDEIILTRKYGKARPENYLLVDAVLMRVLQVDEIKKLIYANATYMVNYKDPIQIEDEIWFQLIETTADNEGEIDVVKFRIYTDNKNTGFIKEFIKKCQVEYEIKKKNKLGNNVFFFDHITQNKDQHGNEYITDKTFFTRNLFLTNRNLDNVFFEQKPEVQTRLELFMNNKEWYDRRGIPYTLGFLLHGSPGCGKTSLIKAVANLTRRHIININLGKIKNKTQLKQLFYEDKIWVMEKQDVGQNLESYIIPIEKRLYVMEDIDAVDGSFFLRRDLVENEDDESSSEEEIEVAVEKKTSPVQELTNMIGNYGSEDNGNNNLVAGMVMGMMQQQNNSAQIENTNQLISPMYQNNNKVKNSGEEGDDEEDDVLDLSAILNILDGTLETPGRMLIITSNYPEKLDHALIRPGRIDLILEFKKASREVVTEMYECFFEADPANEMIEKIEEYQWTPAEVAQIMFKNYGDPQQALIDLAENIPSEYFKFSYFDKEGDEQKEDLDE